MSLTRESIRNGSVDYGLQAKAEEARKKIQRRMNGLPGVRKGHLWDVRAWAKDHKHKQPENTNQVRVECPECMNPKMKCYIFIDNQGWYCQHCEYKPAGKDFGHFVAKYEGMTHADAVAMMDAEYGPKD